MQDKAECEEVKERSVSAERAISVTGPGSVTNEIKTIQMNTR